VTASSARRERDSAGPGWFASLLGIAFLVIAGFVFGLVVGVVKEEPELVVGHLVGRGEEVSWSSAEESGTDDAGLGAGVLGRELSGSELAAVPLPVASPADVPEPTPSAPAVSAAAPVALHPAISAPPPAAGGGFSVQVGSFAQSEAAEKVAQELEGKGYPVYVTPAAVAGGGRWRVRVGPVETRDAAEGFAARLKREEQLPTWVLREGGG
jgi:cell division septation protein DedD